MKLGIVGKGGVGKTTVSALLAQAYSERGKRVVAIDTDSNPNLGISLGMSLAEVDDVPVLPRSMIVGASGDVSSEEVLEKYGRPTPLGATLLSAIRVNEAGAGCTCGGHATVRSLLGDVIEDQADVALVDMEAGLEHLSRAGGTLAYADVLLVVMEPSRKSVLTAGRTIALAEELGIPRTYGVGNKARLPEDRQFFERMCEEFGVPLVGVIPYEPDVIAADRAGGSVPEGRAQAVRREIDRIVSFLDAALVTS